MGYDAHMQQNHACACYSLLDIGLRIGDVDPMNYEEEHRKLDAQEAAEKKAAKDKARKATRQANRKHDLFMLAFIVFCLLVLPFLVQWWKG